MPGATRKTSLYPSKINMIMNSCHEVDTISKSSSLMMCKATELFIAHLAREGHKMIDGKAKKLDYRHLARVVHEDDKYVFLREMMPKKITVSEYKRIVAGKNELEKGSSDSGASSQSSDEGESSDSDESEGDRNKSA